MKTGTYGSSAADTYRGPSDAIWGQVPNGGIAAVQENPRLGNYFWDDFDRIPVAGIGNNGEKTAGQWGIFVANSASAVLGTTADTTNLPLEGGVLGMTAGANNNLSITMAAYPSAYRFITGASGFPLVQGKLFFECSFAVGSVASGAFDFFMGLMDTGDGGTRITSAADLAFSAANTIKTAAGMGGCLGFWKRATTNPADVGAVYNVNAGTAQVPGSTTLQKLASTYGQATALSAISVTSGVPSTASFRKFGFVYDPNPPVRLVTTAVAGQTAGATVKPIISFYVDGVNTGVFLAAGDVQAATFASTFLAPVVAFRSGGTGVAAGVAYPDWIRVLQLGSR